MPHHLLLLDHVLRETPCCESTEYQAVAVRWAGYLGVHARTQTMETRRLTWWQKLFANLGQRRKRLVPWEQTFHCQEGQHLSVGRLSFLR